jgi:hypothetical protein
LNKYVTKYYRLVLFSIAILSVFSGPKKALAWQPCDVNRTCLGNALTIDVNSGKGAQYVDVINTKSQDYFKYSFTFEAWINPERQEGRTQFIGGLWGPGTDRNDVWIIYINPADELVFEINGTSSNLGQTDNTITRTDATPLYDNWNHISAVFDGSEESIYLYVNGIAVDTARNSLYPVNELRRLANPELPMQIGSCNALSNTNTYRTFRGQIDELRMWARPLDADEIYCEKDRAKYGTEDSLMMYYRFNETPDIYSLCDATGNGNFGRARSGANCRPSGRRFNTTVLGTPLVIQDTIKCLPSKTYTFTITDTSVCRNRVWMRVLDDYAANYVISPTTMYLEPGVPTTFSVTLDAPFTGTINSRLQIIPYNWCRVAITVPMKITRITELSYSRQSIDMGVLVAKCIEQPYTDSILTISNNSTDLGNPRRMRIDGFSTTMPDVFEVVNVNLPIYLDPGQSTDVTVRFRSQDTSAIYIDTLHVLSDDKCDNSGMIPLSGIVKEVFQVTLRDGITKVDTVNFGTVCENFASNPFIWLWYNPSEDDIIIDSISTPMHFTTKTFKFPKTLEGITGYKDNYFRFVPTASGTFRDSIVFHIRAGGCTIRHPIYIIGRATEADVSFQVTDIDFGSVIVGQESIINVSVRNNSSDSLRVSFYMKNGESYFLNGAKVLILNPGITNSIPITFIPIEGIDYIDEICFFELNCYKTDCIPIKGKGIIQRFSYEPLLMNTSNVIGCQSRLDTLTIKNISGSTQTLTDFLLDDPSGKYSVVGSLPVSLDLPDGQGEDFIFLYAPNSPYYDRADRAFLRYKTADGENWSGKLFGTSVAPKIYLPMEVMFGELEVGDRARDTITVENISPIQIRIDSVICPEGFEMIYPAAGYLGIYLDNGDSINVIVDFVPTEPKEYGAFLDVYSNEPCEIMESTFLIGEGKIIPLEMPLTVVSYGFVQPCDCITRQIPLMNRSQVFAMTVDSVWIDGQNVANAHPEFFTWKSFYSPDGTTPYEIPKWTVDTLSITFCPRTPALRQFVDNSARLHLAAHGSGWEREFDSYLTGKRALIMEPFPVFRVFAPTRVDTMAPPHFVYVTMPEVTVNPERKSIVIDSITFEPDDRVFFASDSLGRPFSITLDSMNYLPIRIDFVPRAPRTYFARMQIHTSEPCLGVDTTVWVYGNGFAPAFGLNLTFENERVPLDTFYVINCDTLTIPVYSSRMIPANLVDVKCRIGYDESVLEYIGSESMYLEDTCNYKYPPSIIASSSTFGGHEFVMKNFCTVDSLRPFLLAHFLPKVIEPDTILIRLDSISFDTEEVIYFHMIAQSDSGIVIVQKPDFVILNTVTFDSIRVLDCQQRDIEILNTGQVPLAIDEILQLPEDVHIVASVPPIGQSFDPGASATITVEFCPKKKQQFDTLVFAGSYNPCDLNDEMPMAGIGYAPDFEFRSDISVDYDIVNEAEGTMGDTVVIPIYFEKDFSTELRDTVFWLEGLRFDLSLNYNPRALKYLSAATMLEADMESYSDSLGLIKLSFSSADSIRAGKIAEIEFLVVVPDTVQTSMSVDSWNFDTDSIFFLDIIPIGTESKFNTIGQCLLTYLNFSSGSLQLLGNSPNPWSRSTKIEFVTNEISAVSLRIYNAVGVQVAELLNGFDEFEAGKYSIDFDADGLQSGTYYYVIRAGTNIAGGTMVLVK